MPQTLQTDTDTFRSYIRNAGLALQAESDGGALQLPGEWLPVEGPKPQLRF